MVVQDLEILLQQIKNNAQANPLYSLLLLGKFAKLQGEYGLNIELVAAPVCAYENKKLTNDPHIFCSNLKVGRQ